jgi:hypothetical protein
MCGAGSEGSPPHLPELREVELNEWEMVTWDGLGGRELESVLASGAIALLSARWLVALAKCGDGVLQPRQALPNDAFLSLSRVQRATNSLQKDV